MNDARTIDPAATLLTLRGLVKDFPGVRALDRVDLDLHAGEVHALLGENGAGKSTLIKVLSGVHEPDAGSIALAGRPVELGSPHRAERAGISTVHQEIDLVPTMTVADNITLGRGAGPLGFIGGGRTHKRSSVAVARLGLDIDTRRTLGELPIALQQMVAIARALDIDVRVLVLDEPTSSLDERETAELFSVVRRLRERGMAILFVTHFLDQVYEIADRITVLRNGARVGTWPTAQLDRTALVVAMIGKRIEELPRIDRADAGAPERPPLLDFKDLGRSRAIAPTTSGVGAGEALGLAGLLGSGRTELARLLFGADVPDSGAVSVGGRSLRPGSVRSAIAHGMGLAPEDRKREGLVLELSVRENIVLALQARRGALKPIGRAEQGRLAEHYIRALQIKAPGPDTPVGNLSGGNQQKVLLARWLAIQPKVLLLDEPTRGIDVGARLQIETLVADLRRQGLAIVFISAELDEIVRTCDRVLVLRDRRAVGELAGHDVSQGAILTLIAAPAPLPEGP